MSLNGNHIGSANENSVNASGNHIGSLNENSLHASLKGWYQIPGDIIEAKYHSYYIDLVRGDLLIEIQTRNLYQIRRKIEALLLNNPVRLVYPISLEKWILRPTSTETFSRRKSPRRGNIFDLFYEFTRITSLVNYENFSFQVLFIKEEVIYAPPGTGQRKGSWRRKGWIIKDRRLVEVVDSRLFNSKKDFLALLDVLPIEAQFTVKDLGENINVNHKLAARILYSFRKMDLIYQSGKQGRAYAYKKHECAN